MEPSDWVDRYRDGESTDVWASMVDAREGISEESTRTQAEAVAVETMERIRANVVLVVERLRDTGYEFASEPHVLPDSDLRAAVRELEERAGPLPLSLRWFYETVGTVDLRQSTDQLVQWHRPERESASELQVLGEYDPLVVGIPDDQWAVRPSWFCFAPDEFHKANYSGGENYHVVLPDPAADFPIKGMYDIDEYFVSYLRATFEFGGFRGRTEADEERAWRVAPDIELPAMLAAGLTPI